MSRRLPPGAARVALLLALVLAGTGCSRRKRILQCNRFIDKVNTSLVEINKYTNTPVDDPHLASNMRTLSKLFEQLAKDIDAMHVSAPKLAPEVKRYRDMCKQSALAARHLADAVSKDDVKEAQSADKEFKRVVKDESQLIRKINSVCSR